MINQSLKLTAVVAFCAFLVQGCASSGNTAQKESGESASKTVMTVEDNAIPLADYLSLLPGDYI